MHFWFRSELKQQESIKLDFSKWSKGQDWYSVNFKSPSNIHVPYGTNRIVYSNTDFGIHALTNCLYLNFTATVDHIKARCWGSADPDVQYTATILL